MDLLQTGSLKTWQSPETLSLNRLPARATLFPYPTAAAARANRREASPWWRSLDGDWDFRLVDRPEAVPAVHRLLGRERGGKGRAVLLPCLDATSDVEVALPEAYMVTPRLAEALKGVAGVARVEER